VEQSGETHGNNMSVVCESVITVNPLMNSLRVDTVNWRVMNVGVKHGKTDKYWSVQMRSPYQLCFKPSLNCFDSIEYRSLSKEKFVESVCSMDYQLNRMFTIDSACRDSSELAKEIQFTRLKIVSSAASMDSYFESSLQLQSYRKIGLSRHCGVESSRWIGKGFNFNNVLENAKTTYKCD
jgi:hypothetical protein